MAPLAQQVTLKGGVNSAPYIMDPSPLVSLEEGEQFYFDAKAVTSEQRADFKASGAPFTERQPFYGIFYQGVFVGIATGLAHPVRALLDQGHPVRIAAVRTSGKAQGYQGVELELPETDPFQRWYRFVELGEAVPLDDPIVVVNLNLEGAHRLANGSAKVSVGQIADDRLPVTVSGKDAKGEPVEAVYHLYPRQHHSWHTLAPLAGQTHEAVVMQHDSFTHRGTRYAKVFIDTAR